jgi:hypothetical protein
MQSHQKRREILPVRRNSTFNSGWVLVVDF